jgi:hypothetical protein
MCEFLIQRLVSSNILKFRRLLSALAYIVVLVSCGREPMAPSPESVRFARAFSLNPVFPRAFEQTAGAFAVAPFTKVRALFLRASGAAALDSTIAFPATADSLALQFAVPLAADAPASGEPLTVSLYCISAQGDTLFTGGPVSILAVPQSAGSPPAAALNIPLTYSGPGASAARVRISPKSASVTSGSQFNFAATALDANGQPIARTPVIFRSADGSIATVTSPASGAVSALGVRGTTYIIAQLITGQADTAVISVLPAPSAIQLVNGGSQVAPGGALLAEPVVVRVAASDGSGVSATTVSFAASGGGTVTPANAVTDGTGLAQVSWRLGQAAGAQTLSVSAAAIGGAPLLVNATATSTAAGIATRLAFVTQPANAIAGATIAPTITVRAVDSFGSPVSEFAGAVTLSIGAGPAGATIAGPATVNAVDGVATFRGTFLTKAAGAYRLAASAPGLAPDTTAAFAISAAGAAKIAVSSGDKQVGTPSSALASAIAAVVTDAFGNPVTGFSVNWSATSGALASPTSVTNAAGIATNLWTLGSDLGEQKAVASSSGLNGSPVTFNATSAAGVATKLVFITKPATVIAGRVIAPSIVVQAQDGLENLQPSFTGSVTISIARGASSATLGGTTTITAVAGVATFADLSIATSGTNYKLAVASGTLATDTSSNFDVTAAAAANLAASAGTAQSGSVGRPLPAPLSATVTDAFGNPVSQVNVVFAVAGGGGTLSNSTVPTNSAGIASTSWTLGPLTGSQSVTATAAGLTGSPATFTATALAGTAKTLAVTTSPAGAVAGAALTPPIVVTANDASGNAATGFTGTVSLSFDANPAGATLGGTTSVAAVAGVATFANVTLNKAGAGYRLRANASGLTGDTTATFAIVNAVATTLGASGGGGQNGLVASALPTPISVIVTDASGNAVPGVTISWNATAGGGSVSPATSVTSALGIASATWTMGPTAGTESATATGAGLAGSPVTFAATAIASAATKLVVVAQPSSATAGVPITPPIIVQARDATNNLVTTFNGSVALSMGTNPGGATIGGTTAVTAVAGVATFSGLTLNRTGTGFTLVASAGGLASDITTAFTVSNGAPAILSIADGNNQTSLATRALSKPLSASVTDAAGNPIAGVGVNWAVAGGAGSLGAATSVTGARGVATNTWTLGPSAGSQAATASVTGLTGSPATFAATATAGTAMQLKFTTRPGSTVAGTNLSPSLVVTALDSAGNAATTFAGPVSVSFASNPGGGTLTGTTTVSAVAGVASFGGIAINAAATGYRLAASSGSLVPDTLPPFNISAAPAAALVITTGNNQSAAFSHALGTALGVTVSDAFGNPVSGVAVNWAVASGGGTVGSATSLTNTSGVVTSAWTLGPIIGAQSVTASVTGLTGSPATFTAAATAGPATNLVITTQPTGALAGAAIGLVATAFDASGNVATTFTGNASLTLGTHPGGSALAGTTSVNAVAGVATFSALSIAKASTGFTIVVSATGLTPATSSAFDIGAAAPATLAIGGGNNQTGAVNVALGTPLSVTVLDAFSNPVPNVTVSWAVLSGGGSLGSSIAQTSAFGVATNSWTLGAIGGAQTVSASVAGVAGATFTATAAASPATQLKITTRPTSAIAGVNFSPSLVVSALDALGDLATSFTGPISISFGQNPGGGTFSGATTVSAIAGIASFSSLSIDKASTGYRLAATSGTLVPDTMPPLTVSAAAAAALAVTTGNNQSAAYSHALGTALGVTVADAFGNPVSGVTVSWAVTTGGGTVGSATSPTNASGVATSAWTLGAALGAQSVTASVSGLSGSPATFTATATAGAATHLVITTQPADASAGAAFGVVVTAEDAGGNVATTFTGNVLLALGTHPGGSSLAGATSVNAIAGVATFSGLSITKAATGFTIVSSGSGVTPATSSAFDIAAAAPASAAISGGNNQSGLLALLLGTPLSVTVLDAFSNPVPNVTVSWTVLSGGGSLGGSTSLTSAAGIATNTWTLGSLFGTETVTATAAGVATPVTFTATGLP